jgi:hypothetical protein
VTTQLVHRYQASTLRPNGSTRMTLFNARYAPAAAAARTVSASARVTSSSARRRAPLANTYAPAQMTVAKRRLNSTSTELDAWYRWTSWVVTWLLPVVLGRAAVTDRDPLLLRVALAAALASLLTNKTYLGWPRQPWDPMLLGVVLVGAALVLRRWLSSGADGERGGFTARQLLHRDGATIQLASLASVALQPAPARQVPAPEDPTFSGGRSGGAGAGTEY